MRLTPQVLPFRGISYFNSSGRKSEAIIASTTRGQISQILECWLAITPWEFFSCFQKSSCLRQEKTPEPPEIGRSKVSAIGIDQQVLLLIFIAC